MKGCEIDTSDILGDIIYYGLLIVIQVMNVLISIDVLWGLGWDGERGKEVVGCIYIYRVG